MWGDIVLTTSHASAGLHGSLFRYSYSFYLKAMYKCTDLFSIPGWISSVSGVFFFFPEIVLYCNLENERFILEVGGRSRCICYSK